MAKTELLGAEYTNHDYSEALAKIDDVTLCILAIQRFEDGGIPWPPEFAGWCLTVLKDEAFKPNEQPRESNLLLCLFLGILGHYLNERRRQRRAGRKAEKQSA